MTGTPALTAEERARAIVDLFYPEWVFSPDLTEAIASAIREAEDAVRSEMQARIDLLEDVEDGAHREAGYRE